MDHNSSQRRRFAQLAAVVAISCGVALVEPLAAQGTDTLRIGSRVRLLRIDNPNPLLGDVRTLSPDSIVIAQTNGTPRSVPWSSLSTLQLSVGRRSHASRGTRIGLLFGVAAGGIAAAYVAGVPDNQFVHPIAAFAGGLVVSGMPAAVVGGLIGSAFRRDRWRDLPVPAPSR